MRAQKVHSSGELASADSRGLALKLNQGSELVGPKGESRTEVEWCRGGLKVVA